jgi:exopolysaccharide biosynthesis WecB/TagA/CpsF family protein
MKLSTALGSSESTPTSAALHLTAAIDDAVGDGTAVDIRTEPTRTSPQRTARMIVAGTRVDLCGTPHVLGLVGDRLKGGKPLAIGSVNLDHIHHFGGIERSRLNLPDERPTHEWLLLADGQPIVDRANDLTGTKWPRLTGSDLLPEILSLAETAGASVGFLGGTPQVHERLRRRLTRNHPALRVAGYWAPDRRTVQDETLGRELAESVRESGADIVVVSFGKPVQELWIERYGDHTGARLLLAFGAATDFMAGDSTRAPRFMSDHGFEWLYRLAREPRRLARRYVVQGPEAWFRLRGAYLVADSDPSSDRRQGDS